MGNDIKLREYVILKLRSSRENPFLKEHYGLPRRYAPRNDNLNLTTLPIGAFFNFCNSSYFSKSASFWKGTGVY